MVNIFSETDLIAIRKNSIVIFRQFNFGICEVLQELVFVGLWLFGHQRSKRLNDHVYYKIEKNISLASLNCTGLRFSSPELHQTFKLRGNIAKTLTTFLWYCNNSIWEQMEINSDSSSSVTSSQLHCQNWSTKTPVISGMKHQDIMLPSFLCHLRVVCAMLCCINISPAPYAVDVYCLYRCLNISEVQGLSS